jgi:hypothetical protein
MPSSPKLKTESTISCASFLFDAPRGFFLVGVEFRAVLCG